MTHKTYTAEDMAKAWDDGYDAGRDQGDYENRTWGAPPVVNANPYNGEARP